MSRRIALVGHCGFDSSGLSKLVKNALGKDAEAVRVNDQSGLDAGSFDLLLVNRVLDGRFDAGDGVSLIRSICASNDAAPVMLVSNYEDAQADAVEAGALPGFGKSELRDDATVGKLRSALSA